MRLVVTSPQALGADMRIDAGCGEIHVTQKLLDGPQIGAIVQQVGRERVPQSMGRNAVHHRCVQHMAANAPRNALFRQAAAEAVQEQRRLFAGTDTRCQQDGTG